jgi:anti-anti-sigma factor
MLSGTIGFGAAAPTHPPETDGGSSALGLDVAHLGAAVILRLSGHLGATTAAQLADALHGLLRVDVVVVLDLLDLDSVDGAGAAVLLAGAARARRCAAGLRVMASAPGVLDLLRRVAPGLDLCDLSGGLARPRCGPGLRG